MFVYVAAESGTIAVSNALSLEERALDVAALPKVTFTDPQVASVGLTDEAAEAAGIACTCSSLPLDYVPRALANRDTQGFIKLVVEQGTERILGMHVVASEAGEIIQVGTLAVKYEMSLRDVTDLFFPYLTMVEGVKLAALTFHKDVSKRSCCAG
jgi:mercuric reductase